MTPVFYALYDDTGKIAQSGSDTETEVRVLAKLRDLRVAITPTVVNPNQYYVDHTGEIKSISERPSKWHRFNYHTKLWELDSTTTYEAQRRAEYPPVADLADALYWQSQGDNSRMVHYLDRCEAVKKKYPKPL